MPRTLLAAVLPAALLTGCPKPRGTAPKTPAHVRLNSADLDVALPAAWKTRIAEEGGHLHDELVHQGDPFIEIMLHVHGDCDQAPGAARPDYLPAGFHAGRTVPRIGGYQDIYVCLPRAAGDLTARITVHGEIDAEAAQVREVLDAIADAG